MIDTSIPLPASGDLAAIDQADQLVQIAGSSLK